MSKARKPHGKKGYARKQQKRRPCNKDLFLQASYKFILLDSGNYAPETMDPDKALHWEDVICVKYSTPLPVQCPTCLEDPLCPQITSRPPLEDYAFNFDDSFTPDDLLDDLMLQVEKEVIDEDMVARYSKEDEALDKIGGKARHVHEKLMANNKSAENRGKPTICTRPRGKGKEIKILGQVLEAEMHSKTFYGFHPKHQPVKVVVVENKIREADRDFRSLEGRETKKPVQGSGAKVNDQPNPPPRRHGNHRKGKVFSTAIQELNLSKAEIEAFLGETEVVAEKKDNKRKFMDCRSGLDQRNQCVVVDKKTMMTADYDSRFEASRQKLHDRYERYRDVKKQKQIQVIDIQKLVKEQRRYNATSKGKPSLRQKLMAMGTRKSNKKFPPFTTLSLCIR